MAYDMKAIADSIRKKYARLDEKMANAIGVGSDLISAMDGPFIKMPEWWVRATHTPGIPFGRMVMLAGTSDSGKTSAAIQAMKAAQEQNVGIIYVETEGKTTEDRLRNWGVDPDGVVIVKQSIAEKAFQLMFEAWDGFKARYPGAPLFIVIDSIGNIVSERDATMDLVEDGQKPGGKGQINRLAINKMVAKRDEDNAAILLINYTYDNIGSVGKTNAGGTALNLFSSLTYQTSRKKWVERTEKGERIRIGAEVQWSLYKNHINVDDPGPQKVVLKITADGIEYTSAADKPVKESEA